jgi:acid phosphatase family membrane protein YuiD
LRLSGRTVSSWWPGSPGFAAAQIFHSFIEGARESNMISRVTEQRIRSTGGAAHVTAAQVGDLATAISNKTGADDEAVQSGANMLLTFTGVRNEVGKGNDVFNQATAAATDLAAGLNQGQVTAQGTQQAATLLGKALNDPIAGMTALRRVGISFTASQVAQITALQKSGHTLEAQKVILAEVNKEFGGTAKAAADPLQRMSVILGNVGEDVGNKLLPALNEAADIMTAIPEPVYMAGAAFVTLGVGAIGVAKGINAVRDISQGTAGLLRVLGIRTGEVAAAETVQAAAARGSAASTAAAGDSAAVAGAKFGSLAGKLGLAGAVVGLAAVSTEATSWLGRSEVTKTSTNALADAFLHLGTSAKAPQPAIDAVSSATDKWYGKVQTSNDVMNQFAGLARGAFSMGWADIIGRAQSGTERVDRFNGVAQQMDAALAQLVRNGHGIEAAQQFDALMRATGLTGDELQHVKNRFGQYQAAAADAARQTDATTAAIGDENSVLKGVQHGGNVATTAAMSAASDGVLTLRAADRDLITSRNDLTASIKANGRTLNINTAAGRNNADALDATARKTRDDLKAHNDAASRCAGSRSG